jgi:hypothetical protein
LFVVVVVVVVVVLLIDHFCGDTFHIDYSK